MTAKSGEEKENKVRGKEAGCQWKKEEWKIEERWEKKWGVNEVD